MDYERLSEYYERLEHTSSKLGKRDIIAEILKETPDNELEKVVLLLTGRVFPSHSSEELGIASKMMIRAIQKSTGFSESKIVKEFKISGDLGIVAEKLVKSKKQATLMKRKLDVDCVYKKLRKLSDVSGVGSQEIKLNIIAELLSSAKPKEAKYIARTALSTLRIGVAQGILRDSISKTFEVDADLVERAWNRLPDYGEIARIAKTKGNRGLESVKVKLGTSVQVLLAEKAEDLESALKKFENPSIEIKYDGARVQIHKDGGKITLFTRRLEDVTNQFPDLVKMAKKAIKSEKCILDSEMVGVDKKTGKHLPFQELSQRIQRKYDIDKMIEKLPIQVFLFDMIYCDGKMLFDVPLIERRKMLEKAVVPIKGKFVFADQLVTNDLKKANNFYEKSIKDGYEGVMVKNLDSEYQPGRRVGYWLKVKPIMEPLDLVIIGAEWGTGKRANWLSTFILALIDEKSGNFLSCGMMGTGLSDDEFKTMTDKLKPLILKEEGRSVVLEPEIVIEVGYEEIQKSPKYESGFALRFPRMIRDRSSDKSAKDADTLERISRLYNSQKGRGNK